MVALWERLRLIVRVAGTPLQVVASVHLASARNLRPAEVQTVSVRLSLLSPLPSESPYRHRQRRGDGCCFSVFRSYLCAQRDLAL